MCRSDVHSCPCLYSGHAKLYFVRNIVCPSGVECRERNDPQDRIINRCENFHTDGQPYDCAVCRSDNILHGSNPHPRASAEEVERALEHMDQDYLSEFHHLAKQRKSGRSYFLLDIYRTGFVDMLDEYSEEFYTTGNSFTEDRNGDMGSVSNGQSRGVVYEADPSLPLYVPGTRRGARDFQAEWIQSIAQESEYDQRYNQALDDGGAPDTWSGEASESDTNPEPDTDSASGTNAESEVSTVVSYMNDGN